jgi:hypothetical protein
MQFEERFLVFLVASKHVNRIFFHLKTEDIGVGLAVERHGVGEVVDGELSACLHLLYFNHMVPEESQKIFFAF